MQRKTFFTLTLFWSAMLLFMVQPLFARMALPLLGGAPSVWNIALVFFQFMLLLGYLYAHGLQRFAPRTQIIIHLTLLVIAALTLPLNIPGWYAPPSSSAPISWLLGLLTLSIGLPFFALAAQAPLMQRWFSFSDDKDAKDPYFLYAASNIGSMLGLLGYPLLMEPNFGVKTQNLVWAGGFATLILLVLVAALFTWNAQFRAVSIIAPSTALPRQRQLMWIMLSAIPSGLLVAVSNILATDIGSLPMLWVLPLMLYLLSFVIAFGHSARLPINKMPALVIATLIFSGIFSYSSFASNIWLGILAMIFPFFIIATACHGKLVNLRPDPAHMTRFYVLMSLGGAIGGGFSSLFAPVVFNWIYEYPILIFLATTVLAIRDSDLDEQDKQKKPFRFDKHQFLVHAIFIGAALAIAGIGIILLNSAKIKSSMESQQLLGAGVCIVILAILCVASRKHPFRFAAIIAISGLVLGGFWRLIGDDKKLFQGRSFFGVNIVEKQQNGTVKVLQHGTTVHGAQSQLPKFRSLPQTYYVEKSGIGQVMSRMSFQNVGLVGLGSGALSCYHRTGQSFTYFEIDPLMISIARNAKYFSYLSDCTPEAKIVLGDARLQLQRLQTDPKFDLLVIDAFSSDSIPMHLMTAEAMSIYLGRLEADGVLMLHISNRFLDLEPVVARLTQHAGLHTTIYKYEPGKSWPLGTLPTASVWIAASRNASLIKKIDGFDPGWASLVQKPNQSLWTDNFSTPLAALKVFN
jgi:spermidine synthase